MFFDMVRNPRFPYVLKVLRAAFNENGEPVFDDNANPVFNTVLKSVPFGYRQQTANAVINGDVIIAEMKIACPLIMGDIRTKDLLELTDRDRTFRAEVVKKINTNFGTNIWYNEVKQ